MNHLIRALALSLCLAGIARAAGERPNILFLFSDDQRETPSRAWETSTSARRRSIGSPRAERCSRAPTAWARTMARCASPRAMLMTGRTLFRVKEDLAGQTTWPEMFARAGYSTFITGKWHNGAESVLRTFQQGKAVFLGGMGNPYKLPIQDISTGHKLVNPRESGEHSVKLFADAAIGFLKEQRAGEPFLCYVAFNCPHDPRLAPQAYRDRYNGREPPLPANFLPHHPFNNGELVNRDESLAPWPRTPEIVRQHLADYYSYIEFMDDQIARILSALKLTGLKDNTIVVFTSDHGLAIGSHGLFGKQNLYDHSMHSPLIVAGPGIPKGQQRAAFCYLLDIFPTLGELAQVSAPREAKAVASQRCCGARPRRGEALSSPRMPAFSAVRDDRWKLIVYPQINKTQLFDLQNDPSEMHDLAADPSQAGQVNRLTSLLRGQQARAGDTLRLSTDHPQPLEFDFKKIGRGAGGSK